MWTTSSSRARRVLAVLLLLVAMGGCRPAPAPVMAPAPEIAPDAPALVRGTVGPVVGDQVERPAPVELRSVTARRLGSDTALRRMAGPRFLAEATEPIVIEVQTERTLGRLTRTASPEIFLNGEQIVDTWPIPPDRLIAFLPNRSRIRDVNSVTVAWLGSEEATRTRRPLTFKAQDVR